MEGELQEQQLHVALFPLMIRGHMMPTIDIAKLFVARNVKATILATPSSAPTFTKAIAKTNENNNDNNDNDDNIKIEILRIPSQDDEEEADGGANEQSAVGVHQMAKLIKEAILLKEPLEEFLDKTRPSCLVADMFFPWATQSAAKFNIPRLVFHGSSY